MSGEAPHAASTPSNSNEASVLSSIGVQTKTTEQVETSVIQQMKKNLAEQELQLMQQEIDVLQSEIDRFPRKQEVLAAPCEEKIRDPDVLKYYFKNRQLQFRKEEYENKKQELQGKQPPSQDSVLSKRPSSSVALPGNLQKKQRVSVKETDMEKQIRTGMLTPFAQLHQSTVPDGTARPNPFLPATESLQRRTKGLTSRTKTQPKGKPKVRLSGAFKSKTAEPDPTAVVVKKKTTPQASTQKSPARKRRNESITESVPDFTTEKRNVVLQGGFRLPRKLYEKLFQHQRTSVKWLWELYRAEVGGIIADEMGLGKTVQIVAFIAGLQYSGLNALPSIVVCPTTIMTQWKLEFERWWPHIRVEILHSSVCSDYEKLINQVVKDKGVIVTSYGTLLSYQKDLLSLDYEVVALDEGHKIRNPDAGVTIVSKQFRSPNRIILTGAPIQNNLQELWSLFDFIFPGKLGTLPVFKSSFEDPIRIGGYANATPLQVQAAYKCAVVLRDEINPFLLRRMKQDVNIGLPEKMEQVLFCPLLEEQKDCYRQHINSDRVHKVINGQGNLLAATITLRKICNHPDILHKFPLDVENYGEWNRSGKMTVLHSLLPLWKQENHRCLIFTQTRRMLDILENFCLDMKFSYLRMDGNTSVLSRPQLIDQYQNDDSIFLFIMTTKTGGIGVNLTKADRIILYDPDWNPTTDVQARERAWRIGQKKSVTIYRLITSGTIEEKIYQRQIYKQFLSNKILKDPRQKRLFHSRVLRDLFSYDDPESGITETCDLFADSRVSMSDEDGPSYEPKEEESLDEILEEMQESLEDKPKTNALADLLSATGVKHVLSHDSVEHNTGQESVLVQREAAMIAQKAAAALQDSVKKCINTAVHVPTWTGSSGQAGAPQQKRFGAVKNNRISLSPAASPPVSRFAAPSTAVKNFSEKKKKNNAPVTWGSASVYKPLPVTTPPPAKNNKPRLGAPVNGSSTSPLSSAALMNRLKNSAPASGLPLVPSPSPALPKPTLVGSTPSLNKITNYFQSPSLPTSSPSPGHSSANVLEKLRQRSAAEKGEASDLVSDFDDRHIKATADTLLKKFHENNNSLRSRTIVEEFKDMTEEKEKLYLRGLLRNIAVVDKKKGIWTLKPEFRDQ